MLSHCFAVHTSPRQQGRPRRNNPAATSHFFFSLSPQNMFVWYGYWVASWSSWSLSQYEGVPDLTIDDLPFRHIVISFTNNIILPNVISAVLIFFEITLAVSAGAVVHARISSKAKNRRHKKTGWNLRLYFFFALFSSGRLRVRPFVGRDGTSDEVNTRNVFS